MAQQRQTIRFEDLGEPVQRLLRSLKGGLSEEDMSLLEYVSVKDMAKIYSEMSTDRVAEQIWKELREALLARRNKSENRRMELEQEQKDLEEQARKEEEERAAEEEALREQEREEEERRRRKEERRRRKAEEAAAAEEGARQQAEEEEKLRQEEEERLRREEKRRRREERRKALEAQQQSLRDEAGAAKPRKSQKKDWEEYVKSHPLEFSNTQAQEIQQVKKDHETKKPPSASDALLSRTYTPKCPNCNARFSKPPREWDCPICLRRQRTRYKTWQPDSDVDHCMICKASVGRFTRHHCRNCGRGVCGACSDFRALIPSLGFEGEVKVCSQCAAETMKKPN